MSGTSFATRSTTSRQNSFGILFSNSSAERAYSLLVAMSPPFPGSGYQSRLMCFLFTPLSRSDPLNNSIRRYDFPQETVKLPQKSKKVADLLKKYDTVLGIKIDQEKEQEKIPQEIQELVEMRKKAREEKNWAESDRIRDLIAEKGYIVKDTKNGMEITK